MKLFNIWSFFPQTFIQGLRDNLYIENIVLIPTETADVSTSNAIELVKIMSSDTARISVVMDEDILRDVIQQLETIPALFIVSGKRAPEFLKKVKHIYNLCLQNKDTPRFLS